MLACAAYVDMNPIRAALSDTIEGSDFTSAQKRARDLQARHATSDGPASGTVVADGQPSVGCSGHLSPVDLQEGSGQTGVVFTHVECPRASTPVGVDLNISLGFLRFRGRRVNLSRKFRSTDGGQLCQLLWTQCG